LSSVLSARDKATENVALSNVRLREHGPLRTVTLPEIDVKRLYENVKDSLCAGGDKDVTSTALCKRLVADVVRGDPSSGARGAREPKIYRTQPSASQRVSVSRPGRSTAH